MDFQKTGILIGLKASTVLEEDVFKKRNIQKGILTEHTLKEQTLINSKRPDVIDYFRSRYHRDVLFIAYEDTHNEVLKRSNYKLLKDNYYIVSNLKNCGLFSKELKKLQETKEEKKLVLIDTTKKNELKSVKETVLKQMADWSFKNKYPGDPILGPNYKCLEQALKTYYIQKVLKNKCNFYSFAQLIPMEDLIKVGHSRTVLKEYNFQTLLDGPVGDLNLRSSLEQKIEPKTIQERSTGCHYALNYCSCGGLWRGIENVSFKNNKIKRYFDNSTITYRHEPSKITPVRLQVFTRNELVFIGTQEVVLAYIEELKHNIKEFFEGLNLTVNLVKTNPWDSEGTSSDSAYTIDFYLKEEETELEGLELGNLSYNSVSWTNAFNVKVEGKRAHSGCSGLGHARLVYAFLLYNGLEVKDWPLRIQELYLKNKEYMFEEDTVDK